MDVLGRIAPDFEAFDLKKHCIGLGRIGSLSHGTYMPDHIDDLDFMGFVIAPPNRVLGLSIWDHWVHQKEELDVVMYSLRKATGLLLKCNPNILGMLWLRPEDYEVRTPAFDLLIENRDAFSSKHAFNSFSGYAHSQFKKLQQGMYLGYMGAKRKELVDKFGYDPKAASHLIRLLRMGDEFLRTGVLNVWREDREELLAIKQGKWSFDKVSDVAFEGFERAKEAVNTSPLPDEPDYKRVEHLLVQLSFRSLLDNWMN